MPIFEYLCADCGSEFELLVLGRETPRCPECEGERLEKRFSTFARGGRGRAPGRSLPAGGG